MATLHAIGGTIDISMNSSTQVNHAAQAAPVGPDRYTWTTTSGNTIRVFSFQDDITFNATNPTGGIVQAIRVDSSYIVGGVLGTLVSMTAAPNLENYWLPILAGQTTIFASANASFDGTGDFLQIGTGQNRTGSGDLFEGAALVSGTDFQTFFGDASFIQGNSTLSGGDDTINMRAPGAITGDVSGLGGTLNGGDDVIVVDGPGISSGNSSIAGDAIFNTDQEGGFVPLTRGGNDLIDVNAYSQSASGGIAGDILFHNVGNTNGGHDTINGADNLSFFEAYGDVQTMNSGTVTGGNDRLLAALTAVTELSGDVDVINGGLLFGGADTIIGGQSSDSLFGEFISQVGGSVVINASFTGADVIYAAGGNDIVRGQVGNDIIDGGMGDDILDGGTNVGGPGDFAAFNTLNVAVSADLGLGFALGQGDDTLTGFESLRGSNLGDALGGDANPNRLEGLGGNDQLMARGGGDAIAGGDGNDILRGFSGNDLFVGGLGADNIAGGLNVDTIFFNAINESGTTAATRDTILGFSQGGVSADRFHLDNIDARTSTAGHQDFAFIGAVAFSGEGQIRATASGGITTVEVNVTGAALAESTFAVNGTFTLTNADFLI